ncbi:hypothetical protein SLS62_002777 [Diatrype stigma]|uniref:Uncharacterized protein n=1 Tax=Diatrype stigma TaxID=117547 RepID=A0AAN9UY10_9PEZI
MVLVAHLGALCALLSLQVRGAPYNWRSKNHQEGSQERLGSLYKQTLYIEKRGNPIDHHPLPASLPARLQVTPRDDDGAGGGTGPAIIVSLATSAATAAAPFNYNSSSSSSSSSSASASANLLGSSRIGIPSASALRFSISTATAAITNTTPTYQNTSTTSTCLGQPGVRAGVEQSSQAQQAHTEPITVTAVAADGTAATESPVPTLSPLRPPLPSPSPPTPQENPSTKGCGFFPSPLMTTTTTVTATSTAVRTIFVAATETVTLAAVNAGTTAATPRQTGAELLTGDPLVTTTITALLDRTRTLTTTSMRVVSVLGASSGPYLGADGSGFRNGTVAVAAPPVVTAAAAAATTKAPSLSLSLSPPFFSPCVSGFATVLDTRNTTSTAGLVPSGLIGFVDLHPVVLSSSSSSPPLSSSSPPLFSPF